MYKRQINAPNPAGSLTYGDGAAHNVNLQRYDYTLGEMVELDGTTAEAKDLLEGDQWLLIPQDFVKNNYYYENVNYVWPETTSTQGAYLAFEMRVLRKKLNADNEFEEMCIRDRVPGGPLTANTLLFTSSRYSANAAR